MQLAGRCFGGQGERQIGESGAVGMGDRRPPGAHGVRPTELVQAERRGDIGEVVLEPGAVTS